MQLLRVMTINVRQPDLDDGVHSWEQRRDLLVDTILSADPDLIGTQELFLLQAEYIQSRAPQYGWFGAGRFGDTRDKHVGIFYKKDSLRLLDHGDFWLSETPGVPGSSSWDIIRPRQVTWGCFESAGGCTCYHFNTHFPYRPVEQEARRQTAALLRQRICDLPAVVPVLLTADFNSPAEGEIYYMLTEGMRDAWMTAKRRAGPAGTLNGFGKYTRERRIDWILYRAPWRVSSVETIACTKGSYASDHFPVLAAFEIDPQRPS
jgi:endonuclease/exonuclease/phosphatase family metal-dependent hydrolase